MIQRASCILLSSLLFCFYSANALAFDTCNFEKPAFPDHNYSQSSQNKTLYVDVKADGRSPIIENNLVFATVQRAIDQAISGDTIYIKNGIYKESIAINKPNLTLIGESNQLTKLVSPSHDSEHYFTIKVGVSASNTVIKNINISGGYFYTISLEHDYLRESEKYTGVRGVSLIDNKIHGSGRDVIKVKPGVRQVLITGNEIFNSGRRDNSNAEGIDIVNARDITITDNLIHHTTTTGVYIKGGTQNSYIAHNFISDTGGSGILIGFDTSPEYFSLQENPEMYEAINSVVRGNIISNTAYAGVGTYSALCASVESNLLVDTAMSGQSDIYLSYPLQDRKPEAKRPPSTQVGFVANILMSRDKSPMIKIAFKHDWHIGKLLAADKKIEFRGNKYIKYDGGFLAINDMPSGGRYRSFNRWLKHYNSQFNVNKNRLDDTFATYEQFDKQELAKAVARFCSTINKEERSLSQSNLIPKLECQHIASDRVDRLLSNVSNWK